MLNVVWSVSFTIQQAYPLVTIKRTFYNCMENMENVFYFLNIKHNK